MPIDQQLAGLGVPVKDIVSNVQEVTLGTLPTGETIIRPTFDAAPASWVCVVHGDTDMDIEPGGKVAGISIGEHYIDDLTEKDLVELQALLSLDRAMLGRLADMGPAVAEARNAWEAMPTREKQRIAKHLGFAEWIRRRAAGLPIEVAPKAPDRSYSIGAGAAKFMFLLEKLDAERGDELTDWIMFAIDSTPEERNAVIDKVLHLIP